jgi:hypothetical protein
MSGGLGGYCEWFWSDKIGDSRSVSDACLIHRISIYIKHRWRPGMRLVGHVVERLDITSLLFFE